MVLLLEGMLGGVGAIFLLHILKIKKDKSSLVASPPF